MMVRIKAMTYELLSTKVDVHYLTDFRLVLNTYPYKLSDTQKKEYRDALSHMVAPGFDVEVVHLPPSILTPKALMASYHYYAVYDLDAWLNCNHTILGENPIPSFSMNAPALFLSEVPSDADIKDIGLTQPSEAFAHWELYMSAHLMLGFLPVVEYSQML